jgi:hypothetical protein
MLKNIYEIKVNGLEYLFKPLMAGNTYIDNNSL